ncbi:MAG: 16S rRNA (cytosine(967)-C(5))-methyltransferase RsmB [candidate division KSB1 bacterium]|nr:16S rRNA (cytosine(967)-C(5))-methyltransferase RsmB [candidate division KSB1 bacterium]
MNPRQLAIQILSRMEKSDAYADILLTQELRKHNLSDLDKALVMELVNGTLRWRRKLQWILEQLYEGNWKKCPRLIRYILEVSLYQLLFLEKIPDYAAVNEGVVLARRLGSSYWANKVNGILRNFIRRKNEIRFPSLSENPVQAISVIYSHPQWLVERWLTRFGIEETEKLCQANNQTPLVTLRVNRLKTTPNALLKLLSEHGIEASFSQYLPDFLKVKNLPDLSRFEPFSNGLFTVQDESAGLVGILVNPEPGDTIIDLCSAPGGKATHLAELMGDKGTILAVDRNFNRLNLVRENYQRLGLQSLHRVQADATYFFSKKADKVLIDAPCSGLGVLAKRSDLRWRRTPEDIQTLAELQFRLLNNAASLLLKGGVLVYSTCTLEPEENEAVVERFLARNQNFHIVEAGRFIPSALLDSQGYVRTFPHKHQMDGSFAVRMIKH